MNEKGEEVMEECVQSLGDGFLSVMNEDKHVISYDELNVNKQSGWEDPKVHAIKVYFANMVSAEIKNAKLNFRTLFSEDQVEESDCVLSMENVTIAQNKFANSLVGVFVVKSMAFPLVQNYMKNTWGKFRFQKMIRNQPLILTKWTPNLALSKNEVTKVPVWVKIHKNRKKKGEKVDNGQPQHIEGLKLNKPKPNYVWNVKSTQPLKPKPKSDSDKGTNTVKLKNYINALQDHDDNSTVKDVGESSRGKNDDKGVNNFELTLVDSDSEVKEAYTKHDPIWVTKKGASTPSIEVSNVYIASWNIQGLNRTPKQSGVWQVVSENNLSICAILESHVDLTTLSSVCSKVFRNNPMERRQLWVDLDHHKNVVRGSLWILMGDFKVALNIEDSYLGSSMMNSTMCDFKDCVKKIEVIDINSFGLHYTWNPKPKGRNGILKKLDRIMRNIDSEISSRVLMLFSNHIEYRTTPSRDGLFYVPGRLKNEGVKETFCKMLHDQGNLHERVNRLRFELDTIQKAIDSNPSNEVLRDEKDAYVQAFNMAKIDEDWLLKQKAKIQWREVGDSNLTYFHKTVKSIKQRNRIDVIKTDVNVEVNVNSILEVFATHYESYLRTSMACANLDTVGIFVKRVSDNSNATMTRQVGD
nr:hypothetical protein [Tanacetum cinerariifolium]